jgi:hypothetical protein
MERFTLKESLPDPLEVSKQIADQRISELHEVPMIHHTLDSDSFTPLFKLIAEHLIGPLGLL